MPRKTLSEEAIKASKFVQDFVDLQNGDDNYSVNEIFKMLEKRPEWESSKHAIPSRFEFQFAKDYVDNEELSQFGMQADFRAGMFGPGQMGISILSKDGIDPYSFPHQILWLLGCLPDWIEIDSGLCFVRSRPDVTVKDVVDLLTSSGLSYAATSEFGGDCAFAKYITPYLKNHNVAAKKAKKAAP